MTWIISKKNIIVEKTANFKVGSYVRAISNFDELNIEPYALLEIKVIHPTTHWLGFKQIPGVLFCPSYFETIFTYGIPEL